METPTTSYQQAQEQLQQRQFEAMAHRFFQKWQPEDPYEAQQFSAELFSIVRQIYIDSVKPQQELMTKMLSCVVDQRFIK